MKILAAVLPGELPVGRIADAIGRSVSYTSECIRRLKELGLAQTRKAGLMVMVRPSAGPEMAALALLIKEGSGMDLAKVLTGPGLAILPHLLAPGRTPPEIMKRTALSQATVRGRLRLWRGMGLVFREGKTGSYMLEPGQKPLADFAARHAEARNRRLLESKVPGALIVWQDRDEFIFSVDSGASVDGFIVAGPGVLEALGYDIAHSRDYYAVGRAGRKIGEAEALVQTLLIEHGNPRAKRWMKEGAKGRRMDSRTLLAFALKYGLKDDIGRILEGLDGEKEVRPRRN